MRKVVTNSEVPHLWAHKSQSDARNSTGSLFFENETIYSYGKHFPIAKHVTNARGESAVLFTTCDYSITTSGHKSNVSCSIPFGALVFHVDLSSLANTWREFNPAARIPEYNESIQECERKAARARSEWSRDYELRRAAELHAEATAFKAFYDLSENVVPLTTDLETVKAAVKADTARKAKETRELKAKLQIENATRVRQWLDGESVHLPYDLDTMLRIKNGVVETSRGASFPVEHARRGLMLVESVKASGQTWVTNGHTCHLGVYKIDRVDANGTVRAGCHVVKYEAIERIKPQLIA
jgi:hypothetical protein